METLKSFFGEQSTVSSTKDTIRIKTKAWLGTGGINEQTYIDFVKCYKKFGKEDEISVDIESSGGDVMYSLMIADILSRHEGNTIAKVRTQALSGGSIIALGCKTLMMTSYASLSPLDQQLFGVLPIKHLKPAVADVDKLFNKEGFTEPTYLQIFTKCMTSYLSEVGTSFDLRLRKILERKYSKEEVAEILLTFTRKYDRRFPIMIDELPTCIDVQILEEDVGVLEGVPESIWDMGEILSHHSDEELLETISNFSKDMEDISNELVLHEEEVAPKPIGENPKVETRKHRRTTGRFSRGRK